MSQTNNNPEVGPVAPSTKEPYKSLIDPHDITIGEHQVYEATHMLLGGLARLGKETKYTNRLIKRLESDDAGNPVIPYVKLLFTYADQVRKIIDGDPEFQAALEAVQRKMFMERMGMQQG